MILTDTVAPQKRGRAVVYNKDGSFNREIDLTAEEYAALALPGASAPPGVTQDEWESGRAHATGHDFDLGDARVDDAGMLTIFAASKKVNGATVETYLQFMSGEWDGKLPSVSVSDAVLATLPADKRPLAINDGVLTASVEA